MHFKRIQNLLHVLEDGWFPPALICADPALERGPSLLMNDYLVALQMHRWRAFVVTSWTLEMHGSHLKQTDWFQRITFFNCSPGISWPLSLPRAWFSCVFRPWTLGLPRTRRSRRGRASSSRDAPSCGSEAPRTTGPRDHKHGKPWSSVPLEPLLLLESLARSARKIEFSIALCWGFQISIKWKLTTTGRFYCGFSLVFCLCF